jgi:nucleotide-binding universal stress UspA family protein
MISRSFHEPIESLMPFFSQQDFAAESSYFCQCCASFDSRSRMLALSFRLMHDSHLMKQIVTALDFSDASDAVLKAAMAMAVSLQATLHIVHVLEPQPSYTAYGMTPEEFPAIQLFQEESQKRAEAKLKEALSTARGQVADVRTELMMGSPLHAIIDYVKDKSVDLVVIGTHGHGAVAALLIGSVAEGLVRKAICPTLVIPCLIPS